MERTTRSGDAIRNPTITTPGIRRQVVRAWLLLLVGFGVFLVLLFFAASTAYSYVVDGTEERTGTLEPVSGQSLLLRSEGETDWRLVTNRTTVREGDQISTGSATAGWLTLFDQSTVEVSENSLLQVNRMRTSRLFHDRKEIELEPIRGTIYVGMAPRGEFSSSELKVRSGPANVRMRDEIRIAQTGSFLVETQRHDPLGDEDDPILSVRVAVLRGEATLETDKTEQTLSADQQVVVDPAGEHGEKTSAKRELIRNGDFSRQMEDWIEFHETTGDVAGETGTVERVPLESSSTSGAGVQISRSSSQGDNWETGIQQSIGQSLRVHSSLNLTFDLRIDEQQPPGGGIQQTEFPVIVKLNYIDLQGQPREWWHGYYIQEDPESPVSEEQATLIERGEWVMINEDLRELTPLPRQISSITLYASGHNYRTYITNISLTSSETGYDGYD
jgi:hypothetical protein